MIGCGDLFYQPPPKPQKDGYMSLDLLPQNTDQSASVQNGQIGLFGSLGEPDGKTHDTNQATTIQDVVMHRMGDTLGLSAKHDLDPRNVISEAKKLRKQAAIPHDIDSAQGIMLGMIDNRRKQNKVATIFNTHDMKAANAAISKMSNGTMTFVVECGDIDSVDRTTATPLQNDILDTLKTHTPDSLAETIETYERQETQTDADEQYKRAAAVGLPKPHLMLG